MKKKGWFQQRGNVKKLKECFKSLREREDSFNREAMLGSPEKNGLKRPEREDSFNRDQFQEAERRMDFRDVRTKKGLFQQWGSVKNRKEEFYKKMQERKGGFNREAVPRSWGKNELKRCKREDDFNCHNVK